MYKAQADVALAGPFRIKKKEKKSNYDYLWKDFLVYNVFLLSYILLAPMVAFSDHLGQ